MWLESTVRFKNRGGEREEQGQDTQKVIEPDSGKPRGLGFVLVAYSVLFCFLISSDCLFS